MKKQKKSTIMLACIIGIIFFSIIFSSKDVLALENTLGNDPNPKYPSDYNFFTGSSSGGKGSYCSHDWVADAALRNLRDVLRNPAGSGDWAWFLNSETANNKYPAWKYEYSKDTPQGNKHNVVRSYMTYLYTTQMPDVDRIGTKNYAIAPENAEIANLPDVVKWIANTDYHSYHFNIAGDKPTSPEKVPPPNSAKLVKKFGDQAYNALTATSTDSEGNRKSAMKPETAVAWFGVMSHYFADLVCPGHLFNPAIYGEGVVYWGKTGDDSYHKWYEEQLGPLTLWAAAYGVKGGPSTDFFDYNSHWPSNPLLEFEQDLSPIDAFTKFANEAKHIAYGAQGGGGQHDPNDPDSGLLLKNSNDQWDWKSDLENGRDQSDHEYFYDRVEKLLSRASYYLACAIQNVYNKAKDYLNTLDLEPDPNTWKDSDSPSSSLGAPESATGYQTQDAIQAISNILILTGIAIAGLSARKFKGGTLNR